MACSVAQDSSKMGLSLQNYLNISLLRCKKGSNDLAHILLFLFPDLFWK